MKKIYARQALGPDGWMRDVAIAVGPDGRIAAVTTGTAPEGPAHDLVLPAPVNLHSHAFQRAMAGLTETRGAEPTDSFWTWRRLMYRFLDRLTPDHAEAIAAQVFVEMLEAGYGAVAEFHYLHHDVGGAPYANLSEMAERIAAAAETVGIGLSLLPVLYSQGGCDGRSLEGGQKRFGNDLDRYGDLLAASEKRIAAAPDDYRLGVAPHSLRAVSREELDRVQQLAGEGPIHLHLAEQVAEVEEVEAHYGARPVEWLLDTHPVGPRWCLIHCTQMTDAETKGLAATGAVAGLCPITESSLGDGFFNGPTYLDAGGRLGVGSDSNIHIALFEELATLEYSQRLRDRRRAVLATRETSTARTLYDAVLVGGSQAAARNSGRITAGMQADLLAVDTDNPWLCNRTGDALLDSLVITGRGHDCVTDVWSAGRHVVSGGRHRKRDEIAVRFLKTLSDLGQEI